LSSLFGNLRCQPALIEELPGTLTPKRPEIAETPGRWFMNQPKKWGIPHDEKPARKVFQHFSIRNVAENVQILAQKPIFVASSTCFNIF
jgi:hypothetical protein